MTDPTDKQLERFNAKVQPEPNTGCWLWVGSCSDQGYGLFWFDGKVRKAHRVSYEMHRGPIPDGLTIDHLCRVRSCVNPDHLEAVTLAENIRRGESACRNKTHCPHGHPYDEKNTAMKRTRNRKWQRTCRECRNKRDRLNRLLKRVNA